jgi:hypothetical protein
MKIIATDNLNRENVSESVVAENVSEYYAPIIVTALNEKLCTSDYASSFYVARPDNYTPYTFEP